MLSCNNDAISPRRILGWRDEGIVVGGEDITICGAKGCWHSHARGAAGVV